LPHLQNVKKIKKRKGQRHPLSLNVAGGHAHVAAGMLLAAGKWCSNKICF